MWRLVGSEFDRYSFARKLGLWAGLGLVNAACFVVFYSFLRHHPSHLMIGIGLLIWVVLVNGYTVATLLWWHFRESTVDRGWGSGTAP